MAHLFRHTDMSQARGRIHLLDALGCFRFAGSRHAAETGSKTTTYGATGEPACDRAGTCADVVSDALNGVMDGTCDVSMSEG